MRTQLALKDRTAKAQYIQEVQDQMRTTLQNQLPELHQYIEKEYPGSPRTFQRFTGREQGFVGGLPRTQGWHNYSDLIPKPLYPNLWMIGDTGFPGQSTLATALGGIRVARWAI